MNRIGIIVELEEQERKKIQLENLWKDINNSYFNEVSAVFHIKSNAFADNRKYQGANINLNDKLLKDYIKVELEKLENEIKKNIERLK